MSENIVTGWCIGKTVNWAIPASGNGLRDKQYPTRQKHVIVPKRKIPELVCLGPVPISKTHIGANCSAIRNELFEDINQRKCIWKYHLQNGGHFVLAKCSISILHIYQDNEWCIIAKTELNDRCYKRLLYNNILTLATCKKNRCIHWWDMFQ